MSAYYNENDPAAAHVLRALIADGVIAHGDVDDRSIKEVSYEEIKDYTQHHFFAGGGLWSVALRDAGWEDSRAVVTGSCPCQPLSAAGKHKGTDDPRHLWPDLYRLIRELRPTHVFGEQVSQKAGYGWFDGVRHDLEEEAYTVWASDIAACAVDAPHQRARLWWHAMANAEGDPRRVPARRSNKKSLPKPSGPDGPEKASGDRELANTSAERLQRHGKSFVRPDGKSRLDRAPMQMLATGQMQSGSNASTESSGAPNPAFAFWLMGLNYRWMLSTTTALQNFQKTGSKRGA